MVSLITYVLNRKYVQLISAEYVEIMKKYVGVMNARNGKQNKLQNYGGMERTFN